MIVTATEFKAKCLHLLDLVNMTGTRVQVTKRGKVVAELGPSKEASSQYARAGILKGRLEIVGDIIEPLDVEWEALK
ncbi:MAG TPA: type II toxin-antitoxin system prevent-host-death family antitoxin [Fimbriimonadaceae bacterium]|nr:type II toxin-antitoxin system prevent-host-death family antitoxin [Fimbriimonadaceae bacterium]